MSGVSEVQDSPLTGRRIVVTRAADDGRRLAERLRALGAEPILAPVIRAEFPDPPSLRVALATLPIYDWVVFTSQNGVAAVFRLIDELRGPRVAAIGPATAAALARHGVEPDLIPTTYVQEGVIEALGNVAGLNILLPRADIARETLADELEARGARVTRVAAYRTVTVSCDPQSWSAADTFTFTSPSTVQGLLASGPVPQDATVVCIGPVTARAAREAGITVTAVASEFTEDGLVEALTKVARKKGSDDS